MNVRRGLCNDSTSKSGSPGAESSSRPSRGGKIREDHAFLLIPAQAYVGKFLETFKEFPPRQKAASFTVDQVMKKLEKAINGG